MRLLFNPKTPEIPEIQLIRGGLIIDKTGVDKISQKNRMERLSLKSVREEGPVRSRVIVEIRGKMRLEAIPGMILKTAIEILIL